MGYYLLKYRSEDIDPGQAYDEAKALERAMLYLKRKAAEPGMRMIPGTV
jgi:hypothetical protein